MTRAATELEMGPGYIVGPAPADPEVIWLRAFVESKWRRVLTEKYPALADIAAATPISDYHKIAYLIDHASTWVKDARLFTASEVSELTQRLSLFSFLREALGPYEVADIEGLGRPEIYWRLVRPNCPDDVAGAHADTWFFTLTNHLPDEKQKRITKVWFPVFSQPGLSGLAVAAGSQTMNLTYTGEMRHGRIKPLMTDPRAREIKLSTLPLSPGQCVAFHVDLLHKGIGHDTDQCRVSIEFAINRLAA